MSIRWMAILALLLTGCSARHAPDVVAPCLAASVAASPAVHHDVSNDLRLTAHVVGRWTVALDWNLPGNATLYRSTRDLSISKLDVIHNPVCVQDVAGGHLVDQTVADGVTYYYQLQVGSQYSNIAQVDLPAASLPALKHPVIHIDKLHYTLEMRDGDVAVKRYPIALGRNPIDRKTYEDNSTTPEGLYQVCNVQRDATFLHAYDVDYPNAVDRFRYERVKRLHRLPDSDTPIGGEIEIHGTHIKHNWTYGCIALRTSDVDELFAHAEIATGTPIEIVGRDLDDADLHSIRKPLSDAEWAIAHARLPGLDRTFPQFDTLADFQADHHLPVTAQMDARTRQALTL